MRMHYHDRDGEGNQLAKWSGAALGRGAACELRAVEVDFRRMLGVSAQTMRELDEDRVAMSATIERRLGDVQRVHDALASLMEAEDIGAWLRAPNSYLDGDAPIDVLERDEADRIWDVVYALSSGEPSA
jgi:hypothetical protein